MWGIDMEELPTKDKKDHMHKATKVGLNFIPIAGGALAEIFETVFSAPIDKRKEEWLKRLAMTIGELCEKVDGLTPEKLSNNPEFISIYLQASNIAIRTHHEEKLNALNIAVKNSVIQESLDESKKMIFLRLVDQMTPLHIKVFHFLSFTDQYVKELGSRLPSNTSRRWGSASNVWDEYFKEIKADNSLIDLITNDLNNYGLIYISKFHQASMDSVATGLGREFIGFITETT
jgi:hypothetical protein